MRSLLESFAAEGGEIRIYGESKVFRTSVAEADEYRNSKQRVEAMSIAAVRALLPVAAAAFCAALLILPQRAAVRPLFEGAAYYQFYAGSASSQAQKTRA